MGIVRVLVALLAPLVRQTGSAQRLRQLRAVVHLHVVEELSVSTQLTEHGSADVVLLVDELLKLITDHQVEQLGSDGVKAVLGLVKWWYIIKVQVLLAQVLPASGTPRRCRCCRYSRRCERSSLVAACRSCLLRSSLLVRRHARRTH